MCEIPRLPPSKLTLFAAAAALLAAPFARADNGIEGITAVSSKVFDGYARVRLADGSLKPETYTLGNGGFIASSSSGGETPGAQRDPTIDAMGFDSIAAAMVAPLAGQGYVVTQDADTTNLLIMVFWGTTVGGFSEHKGKFRDLLDLKNAQLLGFDSEGTFGPDFGNNINSNIKKQVHSRMMTALEVNRYFVILRAFDFQASKQKQTKLLWETRFSIDQRRNAFDVALPLMAQYASQCFGQDSKGLFLANVANGRVIVGDVQSLGEVSPLPK
jgi:hypothetical protein